MEQTAKEQQTQPCPVEEGIDVAFSHSRKPFGLPRQRKPKRNKSGNAVKKVGLGGLSAPDVLKKKK